MIAEKLGLAVPMIHSVINIASKLMETDYKKESIRTVDTLGFSIEEILEA